jgi:hypothetical protein
MTNNENGGEILLMLIWQHPEYIWHLHNKNDGTGGSALVEFPISKEQHDKLEAIMFGHHARKGVNVSAGSSATCSTVKTESDDKNSPTGEPSL